MWVSRVFLVLLLIFKPTLCHGETDAGDVAAINILYISLGYPSLRGWLLIGGDPCGDNWEGVQCVITNITELNLSGANLSGELGEYLDFGALISIDFSNNHIGGKIPSSLPSTLLHMSLANNHLTGQIPDSFMELGSLLTLDLSDNNLTGPLPPSLGNLSLLDTLHLQNNKLTGTLDTLEDLPLVDLNVENNLFSGPIPPKLMIIPNFRKDGNPFNTSVLPSPPSPSPPSPPPSPSLSPAPAPTTAPDLGPPMTLPPSESGGFSGEASRSGIPKGNSTTSKVVWIVGIGAFAAAAILGASICLWTCGKKMRMDGNAKRHEVFACGNPEGKDNKSDSSRLPFSTNQKAFPREEVDQLSINSAELGKIGSKPGAKHLDEHRIKFTATSGGSYASLQSSLPPIPSERFVAKRDSYPQITGRTRPEETVSSSSIKVYTIAALQQLTDSFSPDRIVDEGILGKVFLAEIPDGKLLAVKKLETSVMKWQTDEGFHDFVSKLGNLRHDNILELVGYCTEHGQRLLIYRFCKNGTLHDALHLDGQVHEKLSLAARVRVALGAARALEYLHEVCDPPVVHGIFNSATVHLDDNLEVRVSDCGLAPLLASNSLSQSVPDGYGAPESELGIYTWQSDVYSFGVMMLELLTGRKSLDRMRPRGEQFLVGWAISQLHDIDALSEMVDPSLSGVYLTKSLSRFADVISRCIQGEPEFRPPMSEIVQDLLRMV